MSNLRVNHGALDTASGDLTLAAARLQDTIDRLERQLDQRQQSWLGAAQLAYAPARAQWTEAIKDMRELLSDLGQCVKHSNESYLRADLEGSHLFR